MIKCDCGRKWYYKDDEYEWKIEGDDPTVIEMKSGPPDYEMTELTVYQCPCGKVNGIVAFSKLIARPIWGVFMHPDWNDKDIDADI